MGFASTANNLELSIERGMSAIHYATTFPNIPSSANNFPSQKLQNHGEVGKPIPGLRD
jgi:hypothetical protein